MHFISDVCVFYFKRPSQTPFKKDQKGGIAVTILALMLMILGMAAFAIDIGYVFVVRKELKNAADAAALAGAGCFYRDANCNATSAFVTTPNFNTAKTRAESTITINAADGSLIQTGLISNFGYWNMTQSYPGKLETDTTKITSNHVPAIEVTITKNTAQNGIVSLFFGRLLGRDSMPVSVTSVAAVPPPGSINPNQLFPVALNDCLFDDPHLWNKSKNTPTLVTASETPKVPTEWNWTPIKEQQTLGEAFKFGIGSSYHASGCTIGQWTSFNLDDNSTATMKSLLDGTASGVTRMNVGDATWIQPGTKSAVYNYVQNCSAAGDKSCEWVFAPVVSDVTNTHAQQPITGFACLHILGVGGDVGKGANSYIITQLSADPKYCVAPDSGSSGNNFGVVSAPRLVL